LAQKYIIAETKTSLTGEAEIPSIPAGEFWLSNVVPSKIGSSFVFWDIPVKVTPGNMTKLELSNDNESYSPLLMQVQELLPTGLQ
jgi:hypothetical protein